MRSTTVKARALFLVPSALLVLAFVEMPHGYLLLLRLTVTACAIVGAYTSASNKSGWEAIVMGLIAILFNPIAPVSLGPLTWSVMNLVAAAFFGFFALRAGRKSEG